MPEGPEIALSAEVLNVDCVGKMLKGIRFIKKKPTGYNKVIRLLPASVTSVKSMGKFLWFELVHEKQVFHIWNTFGLTGGWSKEEHKYTRVVFEFDEGNWYFYDQLGFGKMMFPKMPHETNDKIDGLRPDFLKHDFELILIQKYKQPIVKLLMDQGKLGSGIGNYLVAEILYRAKLSPHRTGNSLTDAEVKSLEYWIKYTMKMAYLDNETGYMAGMKEQAKHLKKKKYHPDIKVTEPFQFMVYKQKTDPYGNPVKTDKIIVSRKTYWVPNIQK